MHIQCTTYDIKLFMSSVLYKITEIIIEVHPRTGHEGPDGE